MSLKLRLARLAGLVLGWAVVELLIRAQAAVLVDEVATELLHDAARVNVNGVLLPPYPVCACSHCTPAAG